MKQQVFGNSSEDKANITLASGNNCRLIRVRRDLIPNYHLLVFPKSQGEPSKEEVSEMVSLGIEHARSIAESIVGDPEAYTLLYSGYSARREKGWHIHIVLLGNRWRKAWLYLVLAGKNILQATGFRKDDAPRISQ
ncbi:hypothetical protein ACG1BZ_11735 [Microbulbifer sp. CNSA002]|uniref:hypothetical protein n=1 Tax=Microbulbifer sp. CNSA002 TaxID=3373604 RepID=UPI0039B43F53